MSDEFSDVYDTEDENTDETPESPGIRQLRAAKKADAKRIAELEAEITRRDEEARQSELVEALNTAGVSPKVASLIPKDANVAEWLAEYGDAFGQPAQQEEPQPVPQAAVELAAVSGAPGQAPAQGTPTTPEEVQQTLDSFDKGEDLMAYLRQHRSTPIH